MSFFDLGQDDLEQERVKFLEGGLHESEDVAVYTWGEESYDGLGDALQEGRDELNDETFGQTGSIGKDFDFSHPALPPLDRIPENASIPKEQAPPFDLHTAPSRSSLPPRSANHSIESIWDDKSPFSVLPRVNGTNRVAEHQWTSSSSNIFHLSAGELSSTSHQSVSQGISQTGVRTLQEIEAEMLAAAQQSRNAAKRQHELQLQQQQEFEFHQQRLQMQHLQKQQLQLHQHTPPPRMLPASQSPRFHDHQRQLLLRQQQHEQQQQLRLQELQEQIRSEEAERLLLTQQMLRSQNQPSRPTLAEIQHRRHSPAFVDLGLQAPSQHSLQHLSQTVQSDHLQSKLSQMDMLRDMQNEQGAIRMEAMRKIGEAEKMEEKRRRKAAKIAHMARYNDLMTQSDKDFITRIQVSQLVTQDPYADDFYAQVHGAIVRSRLGLQSQDERVLKFGFGGGVGLGLPQKSGTRRPSAMQKMEAQVERIVNNSRIREKEKGLHSLHSLQGALGKTSGRSYKAAPRQLLQVDPSGTGTSPTLSNAHAHISKEDAVYIKGEGAAREAAKLGREALGNAAQTDGLVRQDPLSHRQILVILENLYDLVLRVEQLRRDQPAAEEEEDFREWEISYAQLVTQIWDGLRVMVPLETSDPHPFVSLLIPTKGKKILPRLSRHLSSQQMLTMLTLLVACFDQLDVVIQAPSLDSFRDTAERKEVDRQTQAFLGSVLQSILPVVAKASLRLVSGLLGLLLDRSDIAVITQTRPGLALLTLFLSRVEVIKQSMSSATDLSELPSPEETQQWQLMLDHLFQLLTPHLLQLFPSTRLASGLPPGSNSAPIDIIDQPVWQFLAALALHASSEQQQVLVATLREKVLENIANAKMSQVADGEDSLTKLANVNLFLNALGIQFSGNQFVFKA